MKTASCNVRHATGAHPASPDVTVLASGIDTLYLFSRAPVAHAELRRLLRTPSSRLARIPTA